MNYRESRDHEASKRAEINSTLLPHLPSASVNAKTFAQALVHRWVFPLLILSLISTSPALADPADANQLKELESRAFKGDIDGLKSYCESHPLAAMIHAKGAQEHIGYVAIVEKLMQTVDGGLKSASRLREGEGVKRLAIHTRNTYFKNDTPYINSLFAILPEGMKIEDLQVECAVNEQNQLLQGTIRFTAIQKSGDELSIEAPLNGLSWDPRFTPADDASFLSSLAGYSNDPVRVEDTLVIGSREQIRGIDFSPDGSKLALLVSGGLIRIIETASGKEIQRIEGDTKADGQIGVLAFSPDGKRLAAGHGAGNDQMRVYDLAGGKLLKAMSTPGLPPTSVDWMPDGKRLIAGGNIRGMSLVDPESGEVLAHPKQDYRCKWIAVSPDGSYLVAGGSSKGVWLWEPEKVDSEVVALEATSTKAMPLPAVFTPDGKSVIVARQDGTVDIFSLAEQKLTRSFTWPEVEGPSRILLNGVALTSDGKTLIANCGGYGFLSCSLDDGKPKDQREYAKTFRFTRSAGDTHFSTNGKEAALFGSFQIRVTAPLEAAP